MVTTTTILKTSEIQQWLEKQGFLKDGSIFIRTYNGFEVVFFESEFKAKYVCNKDSKLLTAEFDPTDSYIYAEYREDSFVDKTMEHLVLRTEDNLGFGLRVKGVAELPYGNDAEGYRD